MRRTSGGQEEGGADEGGPEMSLEPLTCDAQRRNREGLTHASNRACQFMAGLKEAGECHSDVCKMFKRFGQLSL